MCGGDAVLQYHSADTTVRLAGLYHLPTIYTIYSTPYTLQVSVVVSASDCGVKGSRFESRH